MEIRNLNTFLKVAALQNFTQAARELGYSQSNVSAQIQQLELEIGAPLFNRIGRSVSLTQYGEELLPYARQIVSTALHMENFLKSEESLGGTVRIGVVESIFNLFMEDTIINYHKRFPRVKVELTVDATATLKSKLQCGLLDAACLIDDPLPKTEWHCWHKVDVPIVVVANPLHPLSRLDKINLEDLSGYDFILMEESAPYSINFQHIMAAHHIELHTFLKMQSADMARRMVEKDMFLSVLPYYTVRTSVEHGKIHILNIPETNQTQSVQMVLHINKIMTPQIEGFMEELRDVLHKIIDAE
ncbi:LysR family transcriptional regulator [Lutispora thermophila]|uniref:DNA-binding transcriptional regulator, LysR family n=1 Tax=Lutispora thermophila DSM 19022 TaxID=1122184 RepID=A0A1M6D258_9FIRM|nr:LysR family transcriptional regulator [Lutispora thermophila]SHI67375.1 DNA-binding transcriptional regulator, LysR family [Lutispora thermophila DSM 19022]